MGSRGPAATQHQASSTNNGNNFLIAGKTESLLDFSGQILVEFFFTLNFAVVSS